MRSTFEMCKLLLVLILLLLLLMLFVIIINQCVQSYSGKIRNRKTITLRPKV